MGKRKLRKGRIVLFVIVILLIVSGLSLFPLLKDAAAVSPPASTVTLTIEEGDGTIEVAQKLEEQQVIQYPLWFCFLAKIQGFDEQWQPGSVVIRQGDSYRQISQSCTSVTTTQQKVTIPEGKQVKQIAALLEEENICSAADFLTACETHSFDYAFLTGIDHENRLEGYLFPDTYYFPENTEPDTVINTMLNRFQEQVYNNEAYQQRAQELGRSLDDIIILASMCESEATTEEDRKLVAGVFYNRLNTGSKLQSCVTVEYAMGIKKAVISLEDTKFDSPYNTYQHSGLPIGPICCPGLVSIEAALYPTESNYWYFQSDQYGNLYFAETYEEHAAIQTETHANWDY